MTFLKKCDIIDNRKIYRKAVAEKSAAAVFMP
nr:MAG TPA: hypothetical protein [Caudoviricetes sp.]